MLNGTVAKTKRKPSAKLEVASLYDLRYASDVQVSADGRLVAFVVTKALEDRRGYASAIHLSRDLEPAQAFTAGTGMDANPRFSPDGESLVFTRATKDAKPQLMRMNTGGGEAVALTTLKSGVSQPRFSRDGSVVAFLSRGDWEADTSGAPRVVTTLRNKENGLGGPGLIPETPLQLWTHDLKTGETKQVTNHPVSLEGFDWVDADRLVFLAAVSMDASTSWGSEAFLVRRKNGKTKQLTRFQGSMAQISVSPDGTRAAVLADADFATQTGDAHVHTFNLEENAVLTRSSNADVLAGNTVNSDAHFGAYSARAHWLSDGALLALHQVGGRGVVMRVTAKGKLEPVMDVSNANIATFTASSDGATIAYLLETPARPLEVFVKRGKRTVQVSDLNPALPTTLETIRLERDGYVVEGWVMKPRGLKPGKRCPLVLNVHGGPATAWGHAYMHEFQLLAAHGYAVAFTNIRGSTGYGDAHTAGNGGTYFQGDFDDLMAFTDAAIERFDWLDGKRTAVVGGSYGGVMTNWVVSHTTRFKAAITDRCISNWVSFHGTSDIGYRFAPRELGGDVPGGADRLWERSPLRYADAVQTPVLIVHSEEDHRCPIEQAEQWFVALKRRDVPVRFVRIPGENHELSRSGRPDRRAARLTEYLQWLEQWV
jgi:dipeptidyl aminopeptidase/acylaminoacyl peptidase